MNAGQNQEHTKQGMRTWFGVFLVAVFGLLAAAAPAAAQGGDPYVVPVDESYRGLTYPELAAEFWQWAFSLPTNRHPLFDTADCREGQSGLLWFLGGTFAVVEIEPGVIVGRARRNCTIPPGRALFVPIVNVECSTLEGNGTTEEELRACANFLADFIVPESLVFKIDGRPVPRLSEFRVESPLFTYGPLPPNNILQFFGIPARPGSRSPAVADGFHVLIRPLPPGPHTIEWYGEADLRPIGGPLFIQDIKYNITVR